MGEAGPDQMINFRTPWGTDNSEGKKRKRRPKRKETLEF